MASQSILTIGRNCWGIAQAQRVAFLIDSANYFAAFADVAARAQESIYIAGWDVDSRVRLVPEDGRQERWAELSAFLKALVSRRRGLDVYVLEWDFAVIFAFEREPLATRQRRWRLHRRIHFCLDGAHPAGGSHHQKIVVVDDAIAFVGGIDLSIRRWDTSEHLAQDPRRVDPGGRCYPPVHDVQMTVDGEAAAALGYLFRERWRRATGHAPRPAQAQRGDLWPSGLTPDLEDVSVAIARTEPAYNGHREVREVEALYLDAIASAQRSIFIEAQYLTAAVIGDALVRRLLESNGPEIILVVPHKASGWLEQQTMDVLRSRLLRRLRAADRFGRLRVYCPIVPELDGACVNVHSKVLIVDEQLVRIGSSNLANRSMGLDTECDLALEAAGDVKIQRAIAHFRDRLLGEHLGVAAEEVTAAVAAKPSLIAAVESLQGATRTLAPLEADVPAWRDRLIPDSTIVDPERPIVDEHLLGPCLTEEGGLSGARGLLRGSIAMIILIGLAAAWQWTPLADWLDIDAVAAWVSSVQGHPVTPLIVIGAYTVGGLVMVPVTVLIAATALAFGPLLGFVYSLLGCLASATLGYGIGYFLGHDTIRSFAGARMQRLSRGVAQHGFVAILIVRIVPMAPFTVVNMIAGASQIRWRDYILGTGLGMFPGLVGMTVFGDQLHDVIRDPSATSFIVLIGLIMLIVFVMVWVRRRFLKSSSLTASEFSPDD